MDFALQLSDGSGRWDKQISQNIYFLIQIYLKHNSQNIIPPEFDVSQFLGGIKSPTTTVGRVLEIGQAYFTNRGGLFKVIECLFVRPFFLHVYTAKMIYLRVFKVDSPCRLGDG